MTFNSSEIVIFLGPTLSTQEAQKVLDARYFPPAKQGDILSITNRFQPKVIGLIDGFFSQALSVWHKEILYALSSGVIVLGGSSMGALRAAETAHMGTIGVGKIFEQYQSWELNDDEEVALIHGPAEEGYLPLSIPIINIRHTLKQAVEEDRLSSELSQQFLAITKAIHYSEVSIEKIRKEAAKQGIDEAAIQKVSSVLTEHYVDQKKKDALLLLEKVKTLSQEDLPKKRVFSRNAVFNVLYDCDQRPFYPDLELTQREIALHVALHHPKFPELQFQAINQLLASYLADLLKIEVTQEDVEKEKSRLYFRFRLTTPEEQLDWRLRNQFTEEDFETFITEKAKVRKLQRSFIQEAVPRKAISTLLNELKWMNSYETWKEKSICQEELVNKKMPYFYETEQDELHDEGLIETHLKETKWSPDTAYEEWFSEAGFENLLELKSEMLRSKIARHFLKEMLFS